LTSPLKKGQKTNVPSILEGGLAIDDRGSLAYVNDFRFPEVKRFYLVTNHRAGFVRAWHAHKHEEKYVTVVNGAALFGVLEIDDWEHPSSERQPSRYMLSSAKPAILHIPRGFAHGYMTFTTDTKVLFLSTATLEESAKDDYRYDARYWDIWQVTER